MKRKYEIIRVFGLVLITGLCFFSRVYGESSQSFATNQESLIWNSDNTSLYGEFIKSPALDKSDEILVWKTSKSQFYYLIKNISFNQNSVYLIYWETNTAVCVCINLDSLTQKVLKISDDNLFHPNEPFIAYSENKDKILLTSSKWIKIFEQSSFKLEKNLGVSLDYRIRPVLFDDNLVFVEGYRGKSIIRIDLNGNNVWKCNLPGYVMSDPAIYGSFMVLQTRNGGPTTTAINLTDGKILWSEATNAYGSGVCFSDDAYTCFESDLYLDPQKTEGWLICRMTNSGKQLWKHIQRGAIEHRPVIDQKTNYVYAVFSEFGKSDEDERHGGENEVICFKGDTGDIYWRSKLTTAIKKAPAASYDLYWPALSLQNNMLMVLDVNDVLHFLDSQNGDLLFSLNLNPIKQLCSLPNRKVEIINMPMMRKDNLLVFTNYGFVLYPMR